MYHPKLGRFLQTDPVGYEDQMNLYAYVGNDPVYHIEPTGKWIVHTVAFAVDTGINAYSTCKSTGDIGATITSSLIGEASAALTV